MIVNRIQDIDMMKHRLGKRALIAQDEDDLYMSRKMTAKRELDDDH